MSQLDNISISISKEQLYNLPKVDFPGRITVVNTEENAMEAVKFLRTQKIVGFDTETRPSFHKGRTNKVSLMQISTESRCFLFRLKKTGFECLRDFIEDKNVIKIGLSIKDDFSVMHKIAEFTPQGFVDLQSFVKKYNIKDLSLQKIYGIIFNERISKSQRLSNWDAPELTIQQKTYASIDAWACLRIYNHLISGNFNPETSPYIVVENELEVTNAN